MGVFGDARFGGRGRSGGVESGRLCERGGVAYGQALRSRHIRPTHSAQLPALGAPWQRALGGPREQLPL